jgi:hypothetical protein
MTKSQFELDLEKPLNINGTVSSKGWYNLVVSIRDVKLWKVGMKPHRFWKVTDVKRYFGIKGNVDSLISQLEAMRDEHRK